MIEKVCIHAETILNEYYNFTPTVSLKSFIIPPLKQNNDLSCVIFQENKEDFYIGIQFEKLVFEETHKLGINLQNFFSIHAAAIVSEEISHFKMIIDAVENKHNISNLDIEIMGEIDRFLCLMHWNEFSHCFKLNHNWQNIHDICDFVFQGPRFKNVADDLYIIAENRAFHHLKNAFCLEWDESKFNFSKVSKNASNYLKRLRNNFFNVR